MVEHLRPKSKFPSLATVYRNLYYACNRCNGYEGDHWPPPRLEARGYQFADPCETDMYQEHLAVQPDGTVSPVTPCGAYTARHLRLNRRELVAWRRERSWLLAELETVKETILSVSQTVVPQLTGEEAGRLIALLRKHKQLCDDLSRNY